MGKLDKINAEHDLRIQHMGTDSKNRVVTLDEKTRQLLDDLKEQMRQYRAQEQTEREKLEGKQRTWMLSKRRQRKATRSTKLRRKQKI